MVNHEFNDFSDESLLPAAEQIRRFQEEVGDSRNLGGWGEEIAQCSNLVKTMVRANNLTPDALLLIFKRAHQNLPISATYLLAFQALDESANTGNLPEVFGVVEKSVMADVDPMWTMIDRQEQQNRFIFRKLLLNPYLFERMLPYIESSE